MEYRISQKLILKQSVICVMKGFPSTILILYLMDLKIFNAPLIIFIVSFIFFFAGFLCDVYYLYIYIRKYGRIFHSREAFSFWKNTFFASNFKTVLRILFYVSNIINIIALSKNDFRVDNSNLCVNVFLFFFISETMLVIVIFLIYLSIMLCHRTYHHPQPIIEAPQIVIDLQTVTQPIDSECSICLDQNEEEWVKTKCEHKFHKKCIEEWYKIKDKCPICRETM